jgi:hypothetical protein
MRMQLTRRRFLGGALAGLGAVLLPRSVRQATALRLPGIEVDPPGTSITFGVPLRFRWAPLEADGLQLSVNGQALAPLATGTSDYTLMPGEGAPALHEGVNTVALQVSTGDGVISGPATEFVIRANRGIATRGFDLEDDGPIQTTVGRAGAEIRVAPSYARTDGKGAAVRGLRADESQAHKNFVMRPVSECWIRLAFKPIRASASNVDIPVARIGSRSGGPTLELVWRSDRDLVATGITHDRALFGGDWTQVQIGLDSTGRAEYWALIDGYEVFIGSAQLVDAVDLSYEQVSMGTHLRSVGAEFEYWLDDVAVAERRLPWAAENAATVRRPRLLEPAGLPDAFNFVFGSCNVASLVPYGGSALAAAAAEAPDFMIHLGDYGYPDTGAYRQSTNGYLSLWSDLTFEDQIGRLIETPWIYVASDHDVGGNNVDRESAEPFALDAYRQWANNPLTESGSDGSYGSITFDGGRVTLIWLDCISQRSPLAERDGPDKTMLGAEQKEWFLDLLANLDSELVMIASQTAFAHESVTGWALYPLERRQILNACLRLDRPVRWLTGDLHAARWADIEGDVVEWGAAPLCEITERCSPPAPFVRDSRCVSWFDDNGADLRITDLSHSALLATLSVDEIHAGTSYGRVSIDTVAGTAEFSVRGSTGEVLERDGKVLSEVVAYRGS